MLLWVIQMAIVGSWDGAAKHRRRSARPNSHQSTRVREKVMRRFKSARHLQRFASVHDQVANLFMNCRHHTEAKQKRALRTHAFEAWESVTSAPILERHVS
jgi:putative transposase